MLNYYEEKKRNLFLTIKNRIFQSPKKIAFFLKGVNPCFWTKNAKFFLHLDLVKIRLEISRRNTCVKQKKALLTIKKAF